MKLNLGASGVLAVAALGVGGYLAWRAYKGGAGIIAGLSAEAEQAAAEVTQAWNNATGGRPAPGDPVRAALYSDQGYAGIDAATGLAVIDGEWYSDPEARRYEYQQREAGGAPAATSINGAAFGVYPSAAKRKPKAPGAPEGTPAPVSVPAGYYGYGAGATFEDFTKPWDPFGGG